MNAFFNEIQESEKEINGVRPELLPNTAFIKVKPKKTKDIFISKFTDFMNHHNMSRTEFDSEFLMGKSVLSRWETGDYDPYLRTAQRVLDDCIWYDELVFPDSRKKRCFTTKRKSNNIKRNFFVIFDLFKSRHMSSETSISDVFLGIPNHITLFRNDSVSFRLGTLDKLYRQMYEEDKAMIEEMGGLYEKWITRN